MVEARFALEERQQQQQTKKDARTEIPVIDEPVELPPSEPGELPRVDLREPALREPPLGEPPMRELHLKEPSVEAPRGLRYNKDRNRRALCSSSLIIAAWVHSG
jgi:hypothetical protein